ncbi:MAG: hypothetical protein FJX74_05015 [Armatimonadetes bacterium]|nr:hypothetical protein [Armatimonadota bacterium]
MLARCARVAPTFAHLASGLVAFLLVAHAAAGTTLLLPGPVPPEGWDYDFVGYPAISATGRHVAFTWDSWSVWVADCVTGTRRHLIGDGTSGPPEGWFGAKCPGISANGSFVTFAGMAGGGATQVYLMPRFGRTPTLISKAVNGKPGNGWSGVPARGVGSCVSDDGRYVAFMSGATDLMPGDAAGVGGVFLYDRGRRQMTRVSVLPDGTPSPEGGSLHSMTANGRYVSWDRNGWHGVYVYDTLTHRSERVDYRSDGKVGDGSWGRLSADGRWIVMRGTDLGPPGAPSRWPEQVYVRDLRDKVTSQESLSPEGASADKDCVPAGISADGRYVVFYSTAGNLTPEGSNSWAQVFVRDRALRKTACLSVSPSGALGNGNSGLTNNWAAVLSANGGFAAWCSNANNLAPSDTDGRGDVFVRDIDGPNGRRYAIEGKLCAPAGRLPAETRVQVLKGAKVVATGAPVPDGRFSVSPLQVGTYTVRPVAAGWEFLPPEREVTVVEDTRNLIFTGVPPATPGGFSETYWDAGLGMYGGVWAGPAAEWGPFAISGARVAATAGQDWGFRMGVERGPGGHELFTVRASNSGNVNLGFQIGPQIDATVAAVTAGFGAGVEARESFAREYQFAQVTGPGSQSLQQLELSVVTLSNFLNSPAGVTPGSRLLLNALLGAGADRIGFADLKWTERRGEVAGSASVGASLSVGAQINPTATASLTVADTTWGAAEARLATVVRENPHAGALDDVEVVHVVEQAQQVEVPFLAGTMTGAAEEMQTVTNPLAVLPEKGATGIWRWEAARTRTSDVGWMAGSFTADEQEGNSPFFSTSDAQTVRLEAIGAVPWEVHAAYAGSFAPRILADSLFDLDDPKLHMGGGAMREDLAGWYTCLEKYSEDHPAGIVANFRRTRDRSEGGAFDLSVGLGIGFGLTCGVKGSLVKGFRYDDLGGGISGGDLTFDYSNTDATVPPEDPRTFAEVCRAFLVPTVQRHKPELLERFSSSQGTVGGGQQAPPAGIPSPPATSRSGRWRPGGS